MNTPSTKPTYTAEESKIMRAAKRLPAPVPGVEIKVPLKLWPAYMQLHKIAPKEYRAHVLLITRNGAGMEDSK